jgi:hypothetical protein
MSQKCKTFSIRISQSCDNVGDIKTRINEEISSFLADGKNVIHQDITSVVFNSSLIYIVSLIYEDAPDESWLNPQEISEALKIKKEEIPCDHIKRLLDLVHGDQTSAIEKHSKSNIDSCANCYAAICVDCDVLDRNK